MEERLLVKRAKLGDVDAFAELYRKIYKKLYQFALYTLKNPEDAQDVVSEAVTDAFEQIGQLKRDDSFNSWMYRIVANKCNRKMREFYNRQEELSEERRQENSSSEDRREEYMEVRRVFFELPQMDRMIVGMHVFLGYKTREIAQILEMNENTVRSRESRALRRMGEQLKGLR
jgi:RNA polymerase sigma-70 factor (ECF subfamily)